MFEISGHLVQMVNGCTIRLQTAQKLQKLPSPLQASLLSTASSSFQTYITKLHRKTLL
jgi:hypothetical protein